MTTESNQNSNKRNPFFNYAKYSGIAIQMFLIIGIGTFGGTLIDKWIGWKFPLFTLVLSLFAVFTAIYLAIKDFIKKK